MARITIGPPGSILDWDNWGKPVTDAINEFDLIVNPPVFKIYQTAAQSIANNTFVSVNFQAEEYDNNDGHSTSVNISRYTVKTAGIWEFTGKFAFDGNTSGRRMALYLINGTTGIIGSETSQAPVATASLYPMTTCQVRMAVNDYVEMQIAQTSGGALNTYVATASGQSFMAGRRIAN